FHNLRSSRQTELAEQFPSHVVCDWLGNSEDIARTHYLQTTNAHCTQAASGPTPDGGAESGARVAQNAAQHAHAASSGNSHASKENPDAAKVCATSGDTPRNAASSKGGWGGIRTPGSLSTTAVFKTAALNHSATHPFAGIISVIPALTFTTGGWPCPTTNGARP